jgi:hypothetical protein
MISHSRLECPAELLLLGNSSGVAAPQKGFPLHLMVSTLHLSECSMVDKAQIRNRAEKLIFAGTDTSAAESACYRPNPRPKVICLPTARQARLVKLLQPLGFRPLRNRV